AQAALESSKEKAKTNTGQRKKLETEIATIEIKISKYRDQMMAVKTNEEYRALQHEIEHAQSGIRRIEDDIGQTDVKTAEAQLKEDQVKVNEERKQLEEQNRRDLSALESCLKEC